jgi:hypothetical protein
MSKVLNKIFQKMQFCMFVFIIACYYVALAVCVA